MTGRVMADHPDDRLLHHLGARSSAAASPMHDLTTTRCCSKEDRTAINAGHVDRCSPHRTVSLAREQQRDCPNCSPSCSNGIVEGCERRQKAAACH